MQIQVKSTLTKTRNPAEHGFKLQNQKGSIVHILGDGYSLICFKQFQVRKKISEGKKTKWIISDLEWYVHDIDFIIAANQT